VTSYCKFTRHLLMLNETRWTVLIREECLYCANMHWFLMMHHATDLDFTAVCGVLWCVIVRWQLQWNVLQRCIPFVVLLSTITHLSSSVVLHVLISGNLSRKTVISYIIGHCKIFCILFHHIIKVYRCLHVWMRCWRSVNL
jgi:hypothetical protein